VTAEAEFFFSIAALSASLAGLAGLVAGLRRGPDMPREDLFRLREIVEFCFANVLITISTIPLAAALGAVTEAMRTAAVIALFYLAGIIALLRRRQRRFGVQLSRAWYSVVIVLNLSAVLAALTTVATGSVASFEALLVILLARPMVAFVLVLQSFEAP
jgi:hypothetical protein